MFLEGDAIEVLYSIVKAVVEVQQDENELSDYLTEVRLPEMKSKRQHRDACNRIPTCDYIP